MMELPVTGRFEFIWLVLGGMAYVYYLVLRLPKRLPRLTALLPLLPFYIIVPWRAPTAAERSLQSFFFLWMGTFKLVMLAYDIGPAKDPWVISSFPRFLTGMSFSLHLQPDPLSTSSKSAEETIDNGEVSKRGGYQNGLVSRKPGARGRDDAEVKKKRAAIIARAASAKKEKRMPNWIHHLAYSLDWKVVLLRCLVYFITTGFWLQMYVGEGIDRIPKLVLYLTYSVLVYLGVLFAFELPAAVAASVFGVELPPQFNMPFLATSLGDFWGRRWNLLVNNLLRVSIYNPILLEFTRRSGKKPSQKERGIATFAAFLASGIMHEIIFFYMSRRSPTFEVTMFFVLNGAATVLEAWCKSKGFWPPELLRRVITIIFLWLTTSWLFYPPLVRNGSDKQNIEDLNQFIGWVRDIFFDLARRTFIF